MTEHLRVFPALTQTGETKLVRSIPTTPPIGSSRIRQLVPLFRLELPSPVLRLPLGFEGGSAPFVVGEDFQRGSHIPSTVTPKPLASG